MCFNKNMTYLHTKKHTSMHAMRQMMFSKDLKSLQDPQRDAKHLCELRLHSHRQGGDAATESTRSIHNLASSTGVNLDREIERANAHNSAKQIVNGRESVLVACTPTLGLQNPKKRASQRWATSAKHLLALLIMAMFSIARASRRANVYDKCPDRHTLKKFNIPDNKIYSCEKCNLEFGKGTMMKGCRTCDWDACWECLIKQFEEFHSFTIQATCSKKHKLRKESLYHISRSCDICNTELSEHTLVNRCYEPSCNVSCTLCWECCGYPKEFAKTWEGQGDCE